MRYIIMFNKRHLGIFGGKEIRDASYGLHICHSHNVCNPEMFATQDKSYLRALYMESMEY